MELYLRPDNDLPDKRVDIDTPLLIPLRLPAALLSNLTRDSRLDINTTRATTSSSAADENDDSGVTLTITHHPHSSGKQEMSSGGEIYSMGIIDHHNQKAMDWYRHRTTSADHENNVSSSTRGNELQFIGTTNKQYSTTTTKPTKHSASSHKLKEIGERTRRLLEEERRKRKEIVRLEDHEQSILALPEKHAPPPLAPSIPTSLTTEKKSMNAARKRKRRIVPSNIDGWMPNVDDLRKLPTMNIAPSTKRLVDQQQQQQSSIVRLHGLPMGVKPEHIRKFFHGLNPDRIFVLPSFSQTIQGWDATAATSSDNGYNQQCIVKRHSTTFRVFVKFASSPVANAAIERTGEPIGFDEEREEGDIDGKAVRGREKIVGASISISPISKQDAAFLQKHMVRICLHTMSLLVVLP